MLATRSTAHAPTAHPARARARTPIRTRLVALVALLGVVVGSVPGLAAPSATEASVVPASLSAARSIRISDPAAFAAERAAREASAAAGTPAATVWEGRLSTFHGDRLPAPIVTGVELEVAGRSYPVDMPIEDALRLAGQQVRLTASLQAGVIVPVPGTRPAPVVAPGTESPTAAAGQTTATGTGGSTTTAAVTAATVAKQVAVILFSFTDVTSQTWTSVTAAEDVVLDADRSNPRSIRAYYEEVSDDAQTLSGAVLGFYRIDASSGGCAYRTWASLAKSAAAADATAAGLDLASTSVLKVYAFPRAGSCSWAGLGEMPGDESWTNGYMTLGVIGHEIGHNLGVHHASTITCTNSTSARTPITSRTTDDCSLSEYGDPFSIMGSGTNTQHAWHRAQLGYPIGVQTVSVTAGLDVTAGIASLEPASGTVRLVRIPRGASGTYLDLELRRPSGSFDTFSATSAVANGVTARIGYGNTSRTQSKLIDDTPATATHSDAAIPVGGSLWDPVAGARVTLLSITDGIATVRIVAEPDTGAPSPAANLGATAVSTPRVVLSWGAAADDHVLAGYEVRRNGTRVAVVKSLSWTDCPAGAACALVPGSTYTYDVYAYDAVGTLAPAARVVVTIPPTDLTPPTAPTGLAVTDTTATGGSLAWTAATDGTGGSGVASYQVGADTSAGIIGVGSVTGTGAIVSSLQPSTAYVFRVRAVDAQGNAGPWSDPVTLTTEPAATSPASVGVTFAASLATVTWAAPDAFASYEVRRETWDARKLIWTSSTLVASPPPCASASCSITNTVPKTATYRYLVRALNGTTTSGWTASVSATSAR